MRISNISMQQGNDRYKYKSCTDWVGPYIVRLNDGLKPEHVYFTVCWHFLSDEKSDSQTPKQ